jgi:hypothetical protein
MSGFCEKFYPTNWEELDYEKLLDSRHRVNAFIASVEDVRQKNMLTHANKSLVAIQDSIFLILRGIRVKKLSNFFCADSVDS